MTPGAAPSRARIARPAIAATLVVVLAFAGHAIATDLVKLTAWVATAGAWGPFLFVAVYVLAGVALVPAGLLTLASGAMFGLPRGILYAFLAASTAACIAFSLARYVARDLVERRLQAYPRVARVTSGIGENGLRLVILMRLSPVIPFGVINYAMGLTRIPFVDFVISCVAMLPVTSLYAYYGSVAGTLVNAEQGAVHHGALYYTMLAAGLVATFVVTAIIARIASRTLEKETAAP